MDRVAEGISDFGDFKAILFKASDRRHFVRIVPLDSSEKPHVEWLCGSEHLEWLKVFECELGFVPSRLGSRILNFAVGLNKIVYYEQHGKSACALVGGFRRCLFRHVGDVVPWVPVESLLESFLVQEMRR